MPKNNAQPDPELADRLRAATARLHRRLRREATAGLTPSQSMVLATIGRLGGPTLKELAEEEQVMPSSMTRVAEALTSAGLADRRTDDTDRRVSRLTLTPAGQRTLKAVRDARTAYLAERLAELNGVDEEQLRKAVELLEAMGQ